ncbi:MAG: cyclic nucleotide-binding domain-containing protein [Planctomycetota bacterium]
MPEVAITRPTRWSEPFGDGMGEDVVARLLAIEPFRSMNAAAFPAKLPLADLLRGDTRVVEYRPGDVLLLEGDYGNSAFLLLHGTARASLERLEGVSHPPRAGLVSRVVRSVAQLWRQPAAPEVRRPDGVSGFAGGALAARQERQDTRLFLQDVPGVLDASRTATLHAGEVFGEVAALSRTPGVATVFAETDVVALEIRWQGLRDLMRYSPAFSEHIHTLYRRNSLQAHLRETPLLAGLSEGELSAVAAATRFETHGNFDWHADTPGDGGGDDPNARDETLFERVAREPLIAEEGQPPAGLMLVRSGFARVSRRRGDGHQTTAYLGKGQAFGAAELARTLLEGAPAVLSHSLRAVGYADLLVIPAEVAVELILPKLGPDALLELANEADRPALPARTLDYLVDRRLMNGTQAMVIDLDRCTRCDDCVRACAQTHDGNPRFVRQGPTHDHLQFANACLQCVDPVCMIGCPTGAIHRDAESGVVRINEPTCVGCSTCANSCPYQNIRMVDIREPGGAIVVDQASGLPIVKATKCDLCVDQLTGPACQNACPHDALVRIDVAAITPLAEWMK